MQCVKCGRTETAKWYSPKTNPTCGTCYRKAYVAANKDKVAKYLKSYNSKPESKIRRKKYESTDKGKLARKKTEAASYQNNRAKRLAKSARQTAAGYYKSHYRANKAYYHEKSTRRRRQMDVASLDNKYIESTRMIYETCPKGYEVDHIIPLKGSGVLDGKRQQVVCGLHVPWNLQHLPRKENRKKSNKVDINTSIESV